MFRRMVACGEQDRFAGDFCAKIMEISGKDSIVEGLNEREERGCERFFGDFPENFLEVERKGEKKFRIVWV